MPDSVVARCPAKRWVYLATGLVFALVAIGGVFLPLVPTTFPLIIASFCLARSSPSLERRLLRYRIFAPFRKYVDGNAPMSRRARIVAIAMMWTGVTVSAVVMIGADASTWLLGLLIMLAGVGTIAIAQWGRRGSRSFE